MYIDYLLNCKWPSNRLCKPRKVLRKLIGDVLKDSEWTQILAQAYAFTSGVAEKLLSASHIKKLLVHIKLRWLPCILFFSGNYCFFLLRKGITVLFYYCGNCCGDKCQLLISDAFVSKNV